MSVDECYRGRDVRVFRLDRTKVIARLREAAREVLERRPDVLEVRLIAFTHSESKELQSRGARFARAVFDQGICLARRDDP